MWSLGRGPAQVVTAHVASDCTDRASESSLQQSRKTRSVTFRIDASVIDELQAESDNNSISSSLFLLSIDDLASLSIGSMLVSRFLITMHAEPRTVLFVDIKM